MKIVQKIETGGTSSTSTPMFRFRAKALFVPIEARHITHWAIVDWDETTHNAATAKAVTTERIIDFCVSFILKS
jgi:hypothetical protein